MLKEAILITGAAGEIGQALVEQLAKAGGYELVTLDLLDLPPETAKHVTHIKGSVADKEVIAHLETETQFAAIYHLAALLSTRAERTPALAHEVNVNGTQLLLELAARLSERQGRPVVFVYPSSMAVYGMRDLQEKEAYPRVKEDERLEPITMYGANKLYGELLGRYYARHFRQLDPDRPVLLDFRALRFPGLISAFTVPTGGTSDYGPEMLHAAAKGEAYACFVRPDSIIPFMAMPDGVKALLALAAAPRQQLQRTCYNVTSFSLSAEEFSGLTLKAFPGAQISFRPDTRRQAIVDSWPLDMDDSAARGDWGWAPEYGLTRCFAEYLVPNIKKRYAK